MIICTKKIGYLAIRNYLANILFGFVSNEASLQHLKTQLKLPQNKAILPICGNPGGSVKFLLAV